MIRYKKIFTKSKCSIIGMIHLLALPGCPRYGGSIQRIIDTAVRETDIYLKQELDGILVENMHDIPYVRGKELKPEITATMARVCTEIKREVKEDIICGIQVLAGGNMEALAIAKACNFNFIRAEGFVFSHIADEGFTDACAGPLLRYRKKIDGENILIFADIKKKHSAHSITADVSVCETARAAEFFTADGIILTGVSTGGPVDETELKTLQENISLPIIIGSGITSENVNNYIEADALIIGSYFKRNGYWENELDERRVQKFMNKINELV